jgi:hypothetical protein
MLLSKLLILIFTLITLYSISVGETLAHCPLCVVGAGTGLTLSRALGVDDTVTGVWLAGFLGATTFWSESILRSKGFSPPFLRPLYYLFIFGTTIWSFYLFDLIVTHSGKVFGVDKLILGMIIGGMTFYTIDSVNSLYIKFRKHVLFPYQRLVISLSGITMLSGIFYYVVNYII